MQIHSEADTIVALSSGQGIAAISLIRLSGNQAIAIADKIFKGDLLQNAASHTLHYGRIVNEDGEQIDDVVIGLFRAPHSYTTEDIVEISCHGSPFVVKEIVELIIRQGARPADPGEFTMRAFLNGRMDLSQAEAVADLIESQTKAAHRLAVQQLRGGVSTEIQVLRQKLLDFVSLVELELDFSEEDVEFADRTKLKELVWEVIRMIGLLKKTFELGNAIKTGIPTVIAGRTNAGKSTLLNKLLQEERAIVSSIPALHGIPLKNYSSSIGIQFRLIDTAGIREAHDEIETIGIQRTMEKIDQASILVYVFDVTTTDPSDVLRDMEVIQPRQASVILAANKMDLHPYNRSQRISI
jgi:tRNA modification GTPase